VCALLCDPDQLVAPFATFSKEAGAGEERERRGVQRLDGQLKRLDREEGRLIDTYQAEVIELDELREQRQALEDRRRTLRQHHEQELQRRRQAEHAQEVLGDLTAFSRV